MKKKDPCKPYACKIQECLRDRNFQEDSCKEIIQDMIDCCRRWGEQSFVCGGFNIAEAQSEKKKKE